MISKKVMSTNRIDIAPSSFSDIFILKIREGGLAFTAIHYSRPGTALILYLCSHNAMYMQKAFD